MGEETELLKQLVEVQQQMLKLHEEKFKDMYRELREIKVRVTDMNK